jgi:hypothetical protein
MTQPTISDLIVQQKALLNKKKLLVGEMENLRPHLCLLQRYEKLMLPIHQKLTNVYFAIEQENILHERDIVLNLFDVGSPEYAQAESEMKTLLDDNAKKFVIECETDWVKYFGGREIGGYNSRVFFKGCH